MQSRRKGSVHTIHKDYTGDHHHSSLIRTHDEKPMTLRTTLERRTVSVPPPNLLLSPQSAPPTVSDFFSRATGPSYGRDLYASATRNMRRPSVDIPSYTSSGQETHTSGKKGKGESLSTSGAKERTWSCSAPQSAAGWTSPPSLSPHAMSAGDRPLPPQFNADADADALALSLYTSSFTRDVSAPLQADRDARLCLSPLHRRTLSVDTSISTYPESVRGHMEVVHDSPLCPLSYFPLSTLTGTSKPTSPTSTAPEPSLSPPSSPLQVRHTRSDSALYLHVGESGVPEGTLREIQEGDVGEDETFLCGDHDLEEGVPPYEETPAYTPPRSGAVQGQDLEGVGDVGETTVDSMFGRPRCPRQCLCITCWKVDNYPITEGVAR